MIGRTFARGPFVAGLVELTERVRRPAHTFALRSCEVFGIRWTTRLRAAYARLEDQRRRVRSPRTLRLRASRTWSWPQLLDA